MTEAKKEGNARYLSTCDHIVLRPRMEIGQQIREAAKASGKSVMRYVLDAVGEQMSEDGLVMGE